MKRLISALVLALVCFSASHATAQNGIAVGTPDRVVGRVDDSQRVTLKGNVHPLARRQFDRGPAPASAPTGRLRLLLRRSQQQQRALTQMLADLQNPASASYHKWLTPVEYAAKFGVSDSDLVQVETWLQSNGFKIEKVAQARNSIEFSGTLSQVQRAFHTAIHSFTVNGETHFANTTDPEIPAALAAVVAGVGPLHDFRSRPMVERGPRGSFDPSTGRIKPDLTLQTGSNTFYLFVDPADAAIIYNTPNPTLNPAYTGTTYDGTGISIGIAGVSSLTTDDVANYRMAFLGETSGAVNLPKVVVDGNDPGLNGAGVEALLDTEIAGGIAPKASLYFYTSADTDLSSGLFNAIFRALDDNTVSILSISFGNCEAAVGQSGNQVILEAAQQAAAQGITVTVSSGDNGSAGCDDFDTQSQANHGLAVNAFASTPYTIAVGGTDFDVLSNSFATYVQDTTNGVPPYYATALKYIPENPWNDSTSTNTTYSSNVPYKNSHGDGNIVAGSGGVSTVYTKPAFQSSLTPQDGFRDLPDVSLLAGNGLYNAVWAICSDGQTDGTDQSYIDCQTSGGQFTSGTFIGGAGGTSASAPAFAGMLALVAQAHGSVADNHRLGQADNILYQLAKSKYSTVFHDVTTGNNSVACSAGSPNCGSNGFISGYNAASGYDLASGLGSVDASAMVNNWTSVSLGATSTSLKINGSAAAYTGVHGTALTLTTGVTSSTGTPTGLVAVTDNADMTAGGGTSGPQNNGQLAIPLTSGSGSASYSGLPGGSYQISARYSGDTTFAASTSTPISVSISAEPSTTTLSVDGYNALTGKPISGSSFPYGSTVLADAAITGTAEGSKTEGIATGTVTFTNGSVTLGTGAVSSGNRASWPPLNSSSTPVSAGSYSLKANYSGDNSYLPSSATASFTVVKAPTTITAGYSGTPVQYGNPEQIGANVLTNSTGIAPTGTFQFYADGQAVGDAQPVYESGGYNNANGKNNWAWADAMSTYAFPSVGQHTLSVSYSGDTNYAAGTSQAVTVAVTQAVPVVYGHGFQNPQGNSVVAGVSATGSATILGTQYGVAPTGTVTFYDNNVPLTEAVTYTPSGHALNVTIQHVFTSAGTHEISVSYSGDANYMSATDPAPLALNVVGPLSVSADSLKVLLPGQSGSATVTVSAIGGFTGAVNLTCTVTPLVSNPHDLPGCSLSPAQVSVTGSAAVTSKLTVTTTAPTKAAVTPAARPFRLRTAIPVLAIAFLFGIGSRRRRWMRLLSALVLVLWLGTAGCGGGGGSSGGGGGGGGGDAGTTTGNYSITVTATDAATGQITTQTVVALTVD